MQAETQNTTTSGGVKGISWSRLPLAALFAALGAAVANAIVYFAASGLGFISGRLPVPMPGGEQPMTVTPVVVGSVVGAIGATVAFASIGLFARRPIMLFRIVSIAVLLISFVEPFTIPGAPLSMILSLEVMHLAAWAVIVGLLTTMARRAKSLPPIAENYP